MNDFKVPLPRSPYAGHPWDDPESRKGERLFHLWASAVKALQQPGADFDARKAEQAAWSSIRDHIDMVWDAYEAAIERAEAAESRVEEPGAALERYGQHFPRFSPWRCNQCGTVVAFSPDKPRGYLDPECHAVYLDTTQQPRRCSGELEPFVWAER